VKNYLFRVFDKVGVSSRIELLHLTMRQSVPPRGLQQPKTPDSEFEACRKQAEDGSPEAQLALAEMYANGEGTARDYVSAYMWYLRSERALVELRDRVKAAKAELFPLVNSEGVLEAQHQASKWLEGGDEQYSALPPRPVVVEKASAKVSTA
jgi:hypothetical protein